MYGAVFFVLSLGTFPIYVTSRYYFPIPDDGRLDWEKIVGGTKAANGSAPYQVSLRVYGYRHFCGASIITPRVILTAAHCVQGINFKYYKAIVGTNKLLSGGQAYTIRKVVRHEDYNQDNIVNDIALIFTEKEIQFSDTVDAIELNDEPIESGDPLLLTGWGTTSFPGYAPNDLMQLELKAVSYEECKALHMNNNPVYETQICAVNKAGKGACHGDSGGPLVREGRQVGIVSWGLPCAKGLPDVYTKVESYMDWIEKTLGDDDQDHYPNGQSPNNLMQLKLEAVADKVCKGRQGTSHKQICTSSPYGKGACIGDSGGPLAKGTRLAGIVSYGMPCGRGAPDVFTKVSAYIDWIEQTLNEDDPEHVEYLHQGDQRKRVNYN